MSSRIASSVAHTLSGDVLARLSALVDALSEALGPELHGLVVYGSAARGEWRDGVSDVNLLIETGVIDFERIDAMAGALSDARERGRVEPLLLTDREIRTGADAFAVLVEDIRRDHTRLMGTSALLQVSTTTEQLRLGAERELRGAHMRLRRARMGFTRSDDSQRRRLYRDYTRCMASLKALLALSSREVPPGAAAVEAAVAALLDVDAAPLAALRALPGADADAPLAAVAAGFSATLDAAIERIDALAL